MCAFVFVCLCFVWCHVCVFVWCHVCVCVCCVCVCVCAFCVVCVCVSVRACAYLSDILTRGWCQEMTSVKMLNYTHVCKNLGQIRSEGDTLTRSINACVVV